MSTEKISRKDLKTPDKFFQVSVSFIQRTVKIYHDHKKQVMIALVAIVVLAFIALGYSEYKNYKYSEAAFALAKADAALEKASENPIDNLVGENKEEKKVTPKLTPEVEKLYLEVINGYSGTFSAMMAELKLGDIYFQSGEYDKSFEIFKKFKNKSSNNVFGIVSTINLAYIKEIQKDYKAALTYFEEINKGNVEIFQIQGLFGMSRCYEKLHEKDKAKDIYNQIISKYPNSEHAKSARNYLSILDELQ